MPKQWSCPKCGGGDLEVTIQCQAKLIQEDDGNYQTDTDEVLNHDHEWGETSTMRCRFCGHVAIAARFENE